MFSVGVPSRRVGEPVQVKVGTESRVDDGQHVLLKLSRDAGAVDVGGQQPGRVFHQVDAQQQTLARPQAGRHRSEKSSPLLPGQVAYGAAEEGDQAAVGVGQPIQVQAEIADNARHLDGRVGRRQAGHGVTQRGLGDVEGNEAAQGAGVPEGVEKGHRLVRGPRTELDQRRCAAADRNFGRVRGQYLILGPGEVVLRQFGDALKERRPARVIQPSGRNLLRCGRQAASYVIRQGGFGAADVDRDRRSGC